MSRLNLLVLLFSNPSQFGQAPTPDNSSSKLTDGSNRAFLSNQKGQIWLVTIPEIGSGRGIDLDESNPFLDLTDEVYFDTQFGLMSIALHPNFAQNGRFFASFNCDKSETPSCAGSS